MTSCKYEVHLTANYISCVNDKSIRICDSLHKPLKSRGLGGAREQALHNFPKFQHCSPVQSLQLPSWLFMTMTFYTKTTLHTATTLPPVTIICFEIRNLIMMVSDIHDDEWLKPLSSTLEIGFI